VHTTAAAQAALEIDYPIIVIAYNTSTWKSNSCATHNGDAGAERGSERG